MSGFSFFSGSMFIHGSFMISSKMCFSLGLGIGNFLSRFSLSMDMRKETLFILHSSPSKGRDQVTIIKKETPRPHKSTKGPT